MHAFVERYRTTAVPALKERTTYASEYLVPSLVKVIVNVGIGDIRDNNQALEQVFTAIQQITGQKPVYTKARISEAGFKIREGMKVGIKVTLRGERMHDFLMKLVEVALPRTRDYRGIKPSAVTTDGMLNIGMRDFTIFPEALLDTHVYGMQITVVSTAKTREEAELLYAQLGFPIQGTGVVSLQ